jgi:protein-tyrosine-phosphatase
MKNILFVCTGNTCRSPMAEALLKNKNSDKFQVKSAGVFATNGNEASKYAVEALAEKGIEHNHCSALLTRDLMDWAMYILTMTNSHKEMVINQFPEANQKVFTLKEFVKGVKEDIVDPYGGPKELYQRTLNELETLIDDLVKMQ